MEFDLENPLTSPEDDQSSGGGGDPIATLFSAEHGHMCDVSGGLLDVSARRDAAAFILQAQYTCNLDPFMAYLAVNYADRFLSKQEIPKGKPWILRLLSISCLSLASKMRKKDFSLADFQMEEGFIYDAQTIGRMELLVLGALDWRMRSITPFSFLRYFLAFFSPAHPPHVAALKTRATNILLKAQTEIKMLRFPPSVVAAAALLSAAHELFPVQFAAYRSAVAACEFVNKESVLECYNAMVEVAADGGDSAAGMISSCDTPVTVLRRGQHHHSSSTESEQTIGDPDQLKKRRTSGGGVASETTAFRFRRPYN